MRWFGKTQNKEPKPRDRKRQAIIGALLLGAIVAVGLYLSSESFADRVRLKVIADLEEITGGRVELKNFRWNLGKLEFEADDLTIHGLEPAGEVPYAHADHLAIQIKIISLFSREIGLHYAGVDRPVIHIMVLADGSTNQPVPKVEREKKGSAVEQLFRLAMDRFELHDGALLWNDQRLPFDVTGEQMKSTITYGAVGTKYDGTVAVGRLNTKFKTYAPLLSSASVAFSLHPSLIEVRSLQWASGDSNFAASGALKDFSDPHVTLGYRAVLDLQQAGEILKHPALRGGKLELSGRGEYNLKDFSSAGHAILRDLRYDRPALHLHSLAGAADFNITPHLATFRSIQVQALGGRATGVADVKNWATLPDEKDSPQQTGTASFEIEGMQVASVIAALEPVFEKAKFAGKTNGTVDFDWRRTPMDAHAVINVDVAPPQAPAREDIPVTAVVRAETDFAADSLRLQQLSMATRATRLNAAGDLGKSTTKVNVSLNTTDLSEFQPALVAFGANHVPVAVNGRASFNGSLSGRVQQPSMVGHVELHDFDSLITPAQGSQQKPLRLHWESFASDIELAASRLAVHHGVLQKGASQINVDGTSALVDYFPTVSTAFALTLNVSNATVGEVQSLAGYSYPVDGVLDLTAHLSGTRQNVNGDSNIRIANGSAYGQPFKSATAQAHFAGQQLEFRRLAVVESSGAGNLEGTASYNLQSGAFTFDINGKDFQLARVRQLQNGRYQIAGVGDFHANGSGTAVAPVINARVHLRDLVLNGESAGELDADAVTHGADLKLSARSHMQQASLAVDGTVHMRDQWPGKIAVHLISFDVDPILRARAGLRTTGHSRVAGELQLEGPFREPRLLTAHGDFSSVNLEIENLKLVNDGPVRFTYQNQSVNFERLHIVGDGTDLTAEGSLDLVGERRLHIRSEGKANLKLLQYFDPDVISSGFTKAGLEIGGTMDKPDITGKFEVSNGAIALIDLPNGLSEINGTFNFNQDRLQIEKLTAKSGGGALDIGGYITVEKNPYFALNATGRDIRLRYPQGVSAVANADLQFVGTTRNSTLLGDVTVNRFGLNPRFDFALYLARSNQPTPTPQPNSPLNSIHLNVHVLTAPELQVQTSLAKVSGDADLHLGGTVAQPVVLGRINVVEGDVFLNGTKYSLDRGDILFANPVGIQPVLNLEATARVRDYDITIGFHGPVDKLTTTYRSDPPLPTADIIALLALGRTREEAALQPNQQSTFTTDASNAILGGALNAALSSRVQKLFGVSRIKIDPNSQQQDVGLADCRGFCVTIEQQVSDKVTLTYITNPSQASQQIIQAEFNINRNLSIVAVRDQYGVVGFDVKWKQRKR
ncbi:MAG: translocation/assembly module TamB domain-containing protein [Terriglobales bacterium]